MPRNAEMNEKMRYESRGQILTTARHLFAGQGYFQCKMADIARAAGMSAGNIYYYFATKEDLLKAILEEGFTLQEQVLAQAAALPGSSQARLDNLIDRFIELCREQGEFITVLLSLLGQKGAPFLAEIGFDLPAIGARYHALIEPIFQQAIAAGIAEPQPPGLQAMLFFSLFNGLLLTYGSDWQRLDPDLFHAAILRMVAIRSP